MSETRIRFAGTGGQGIAVAALLLAEAAVRSGRNATHSQSYGPESRGGASRADVIVGDDEIAYPIASALDVLVALAPAGLDRSLRDLREGALVLADSGLDVPDGGYAVQRLPLVATAHALLGPGPGANLVALGAFVRLAGILPVEAVADAIRARPPGGSVDRALMAFNAGAALAESAGRAGIEVVSASR